MVLVTYMSTLVTLASLAIVRAEVLQLEEACGVLLQVDNWTCDEDEDNHDAQILRAYHHGTFFFT